MNFNKIIENSFFTNTKVVYAIVLSTLLFWAFFAYFTMMQIINSQEKYAKLINISGKQRMLSQKTTLIAKRVFETKDKKLFTHLNDLIDLMKSDHRFLLENLPTQNMRDIYLKGSNNLDKKVNTYFEILDTFINKQNKQTITNMQNYSFTLLPKLDYAVYMFEKESDMFTQNLKSRELYILLGTILTIFLEALLIVVPSINQTQKAKKELEQLNANLQKKIEKEINEKRQQDQLLIQQSRLASMGEMIGNIAHQWRQPLNVITIYLQDLLSAQKYDELDTEYLKENVKKCRVQIEYMSTTIDDFKNFYQPDKEKVSFDINNSIKEAIKLEKASFSYHNISIDFKTEENNIKIFGYPNELAQVIINIFNNAKDAFISLKKEKELKIEIKSYIDNSFATIEIIDNATGIPNNILEKIFDPYFTTKHQAQGTGVGLYMSKVIIEKNMDGYLNAQNTEDGARFIIKIPIKNF